MWSHICCIRSYSLNSDTAAYFSLRYAWILDEWTIRCFSGAFFQTDRRSHSVPLLTVRSCDVCNYWQMFQSRNPPHTHTHSWTPTITFTHACTNIKIIYFQPPTQILQLYTHAHTHRHTCAHTHTNTAGFSYMELSCNLDRPRARHWTAG